MQQSHDRVLSYSQEPFYRVVPLFDIESEPIAAGRFCFLWASTEAVCSATEFHSSSAHPAIKLRNMRPIADAVFMLVHQSAYRFHRRSSLGGVRTLNQSSPQALAAAGSACR